MIATDLIAVAGLTLSGPSAYYVLTGTLDKTALLLYVLNFLFFGGSVFYVHMKIQFSAAKKTRLTWKEQLIFGRLNLFYFVAVVVMVVILAEVGLAPIIVLTGVHSHDCAWSIRDGETLAKIHFKTLGFLLLGQSILFGMFLCFFSWK